MLERAFVHGGNDRQREKTRKRIQKMQRRAERARKDKPKKLPKKKIFHNLPPYSYGMSMRFPLGVCAFWKKN